MSTILGLKRAQQITQLLGQESNGVSSILLYGPSGCGKTLLVQQLTEKWLGSKSDPTERAIESFRRGANPDFHHIKPSGPSNNIKAEHISPSSPRSSDDPLAVTEYVRVSPLYSRNKVIWIEEAHRLNRFGFNALLKTLEEPPEYVKIVLTSSQISQIPATILSRCLVINCELPTQVELQGHFGGVPLDLTFLAEGSPGTLSKMSENVDLYFDIVKYSDRLVLASPYQALMLGDEFRRLSDRLEDAEKIGIRNSNARTLELIGISICHRSGHRSDAVQHITKAHRRVISNANPSLVLDAMIGKIVIKNKVGTNA